MHIWLFWYKVTIEVFDVCQNFFCKDFWDIDELSTTLINFNYVDFKLLSFIRPYPSFGESLKPVYKL